MLVFRSVIVIKITVLKLVSGEKLIIRAQVSTRHPFAHDLLVGKQAKKLVVSSFLFMSLVKK